MPHKPERVDCEHDGAHFSGRARRPPREPQCLRSSTEQGRPAGPLSSSAASSLSPPIPPRELRQLEGELGWEVGGAGPLFVGHLLYRGAPPAPPQRQKWHMMNEDAGASRPASPGIGGPN